MKSSFLVASLYAGLVACSGGSSSPGNINQTGVFLDSPVINIGYRTETLDGVTNSLGEYEYIEGETVTFFIGDLELPPVAATGTVTPLNLAGRDDTSDPTVVNIIRLLQTLDEDGNPDNGITITDAAKTVATQVDFELSIIDFESSSAVTNLVSNSGSSNTVLISQSEAVAHFEDTLVDEGESFVANSSIAGIWTNELTDNELLAFVFFADGTYVHLEVDEQAPFDSGDVSGMEWGTYSRDSETGELTIAHTFDANGARGLTDSVNGQATFFAQVSGDVLTLQIDEGQSGTVDASIDFQRHFSGFTNFSFDAAILAGVYEVVGAAGEGFAGTHQYTFNQNGTVDIVYADGTADTESWSVNSNGQLVFSGTIADVFTLTSGSQLSGDMDLVIDDADGSPVINTTGTIERIDI